MKELLKNFTILYVEDEDDVRRNAIEYLRRICKEVLEAKDGKEAISVWKEHRPDIIITDIIMICWRIDCDWIILERMVICPIKRII